MVSTATFKDQTVPHYLTEGNMSQYIIPVAQQVCKGIGLDIGCGKIEWSFPNSYPVDPEINTWNAFDLPEGEYDYIFSSHCLEHIDNYMEALRYWTGKIKPKGVLFLYLPHYDCVYWRPWHMSSRKHIHQFYPKQLVDIFETLGYTKIFCSERDLVYSFSIFGEKA